MASATGSVVGGSGADANNLVISVPNAGGIDLNNLASADDSNPNVSIICANCSSERVKADVGFDDGTLTVGRAGAGADAAEAVALRNAISSSALFILEYPEMPNLAAWSFSSGTFIPSSAAVLPLMALINRTETNADAVAIIFLRVKFLMLIQWKMIFQNLTMGVPTFFHWLVSRFEELILHKKFPGGTENPDALYIDLNCAIHPAVKADPNMKLADMPNAVLTYLKNIVKFTNPQKLLFIAIDGVAPRAKMEQQRSRRYKSVRESKLIRDIKKRHAQPVPANDDVVDFNMISPGTEFMTVLAREIERFIVELKKTEWKHLQIHFSDASVPGEGEHKIMHHIRNFGHGLENIAIYGLDSDLIFLSMLNCGKPTALVRENKEFGKFGTTTTHQGGGPGESRFPQMQPEVGMIFLSIDHLKDTLISIMSPIVSFTELEGVEIFNNFQFEPPPVPCTKFYTGSAEDRHRLVLDYVFICFLLGNDFVPHIPSLSIRDGGLDSVIQAYKVTSWKLGTFLVGSDGLTINLKFFVAMLKELTAVEDKLLVEAKSSKIERIERFNRKLYHLKPFEREIEDMNYVENKYTDIVQPGTDGWRTRYYLHHFGIPFRHKTEFARHLEPICLRFLEGMMWTLGYYQGKHNNWSWWYNYEEAPTLVDLLNCLQHTDLNSIAFPNDEPVSPFVQLLSILPPESSDLLPKEIGGIMTARDSDLHYMYPLKIEISIQGKRFLWECKPRLPEIDAEALVGLVGKIHGQRSRMSPDIYQRNVFGKSKLF